jgi:uncharacterized membrane protein (UPF0127 family)
VSRARLVVAAVGLVLLLPGGAAASTAKTAALRLDGAPLRPQLALTPAERAVGLMRRAEAPRDGMLFVFPAATREGFWMKNTLVPLAIVFFDSAGKRVRKLAMTPCKADPCPVYYPRRSYRFALELPASDSRQARTLGPRDALRRLAARAR